MTEAILRVDINQEGKWDINHHRKGLIATCPTEEAAVQVATALTYFRKATEMDQPEPEKGASRQVLESATMFMGGCMAVVFRAYLSNAVPADYQKNLWNIATKEMASVAAENGLNVEEANRALTIARVMVLSDFQDDDKEKVMEWLEHLENLA